MKEIPKELANMPVTKEMRFPLQPQESDRHLLSVVVIARNEARNIGRCIESVLKATASYQDTEIILVDSASTDETVDIALQFPISIIQLRSNWSLTPGAGRYLGTLKTSGEHILFLDGDTQISSGWIPEGLTLLSQNSEIAGVGGVRDEIYIDEHGQPTGEVIHRYKVNKETEVKSLGGDGLYRRAALEEVGTFHPYLALYEETELALRLRKAEYSLWRLPLLMTYHYSLPRGTLREAIRRFQVGFYPRSGRTLRAAYKNGLAGRFIREFLMNYVITAGYLLLGIASIIAALFGRDFWFMAWLTSSAIIFGAYSVRKRSIYKAISNFVARVFVLYGLVIGFVTGGKDADEYPTDVIIVKLQGEKSYR